MSSSQVQTESVKPKRRRWWRILLAAFVALIVLVGALALFVQTNFAFQQLLLPLASSHVEGDLEIEEGSISLMGGLKLRGISLTNMPPIESFTADSFDAKISLASLMGGGAPRVESVELINPTVVVNDSVKKSDDKADEDKDDENEKDGKPGDSDGPMLPVALDSIKIENLNATMKSEGRTQAKLNKMNFTLAGLAPGSSAEAKLNADFEIAPDDAAQARTGMLALSLKVAQPEDGRSFQYEGTSVAAIQEGKPRPDGGVTADLRLDMQTLKGSLSRDGIIQCTLEALASTAKEQAGSVSVALDYDAKQNKIQGDIEVSDVGREVLNPFLAMYGPAQIESAKFDTKITIQNEGDSFRFLSKLTGTNLSVRPEKGQEATPKLDITSEHAGLWNPKTMLLTVEKADINIIREGKPVGDAGLDQALTLDLDTSKGGTAKEMAPKEARVTVQIDDLEAENVRPWLKAFNSDALDPVRSGDLSGKLTATIHGMGETIDWAWDAGLADLRIRPEEKGDTLGPFKISQQLSGTIKDFKAISLNSGTIEVQSDGSEIASTTISGTHELESGATDLKVRFSSPNLGRAIRSVGAMKSGERFELREGSVVNDVTLRRAGKDDAILIAGTTKADGVTLVADGKRTLGQSIASAYDLKINAQMSDVEITKFDVSMKDGAGAAAGQIGANGFWPLKKPAEGEKPGRGGRATAKIAGISAAPWIKFLDLGDGRDLGSVPVDGDLAVTMDASGEKFSYEGQWVTTIRMDNGGVSEDVKVTVENSIRKLNDQIESFVADLNATRKNGQPDKVSIQGKGTLGDRPSFNADIKVASFDAGFYADAFAPKKSESKDTKDGSSAAPSNAESDAPKSTSAKSKEFPADMNVTFAVDRLTYRDLKIGGMSGTLFSDAKNLKAKLDGMKINQGNIDGNAELAHVSEGLKMVWKFQGSGVDIGPVINSLSESQRDKVEGRLTFNSQGQGIQVEGEKRPDLDGNLVFDLADGQLKNSKLLNKISEATGTDVFNQLVYKGIHGDIELADGWANIKEMVVNGNATRLIADGRIGLDGELEVDVQPAIGPEVSKTMGSNNKFTGYLGSIAGTTSDLLAFPIAVTARGNASDPKYSVKPKLPPGVSDLEDLIGGTVKGIVGGGKEGSKDVIEGIGGAVGGLTKGLLDRKKK